MSRIAFYYAHTNGTDKAHWQLLKDHLLSVAELARRFASAFGAGSYGYSAGLLHDLGKFSKEFQQRLNGAPLKVDHSTAGAQQGITLYGQAIGRVLAYIVAGHHAGIPDYGSIADESSLAARLRIKSRLVCKFLSYQ